MGLTLAKVALPFFPLLLGLLLQLFPFFLALPRSQVTIEQPYLENLSLNLRLQLPLVIIIIVIVTIISLLFFT